MSKLRPSSPTVWTLRMMKAWSPIPVSFPSIVFRYFSISHHWPLARLSFGIGQIYNFRTPLNLICIFLCNFMCLCFCNIWLYLAPTPTLYIYYLNLYLAPMINVKIFVLYLCALVCIHIPPTTQYSLNVPKIWIPMFVSTTEPPSTTPKTFHVLCTYLQQYHHHYHRIHPKIDERSRCLRLNGKFYCHCKKFSWKFVLNKYGYRRELETYLYLQLEKMFDSGS